MTQLRHWHRHFLVLLASVFAVALGLHGQQAAKKGEPATGTVAGSVSCADTNAPARFALVTLQRVPSEKSAETGGRREQDCGDECYGDYRSRWAVRDG